MLASRVQEEIGDYQEILTVTPEEEQKFAELLINFFNELMPPGTDSTTRSDTMCDIEDTFDSVVWEWFYGKKE